MLSNLTLLLCILIVPQILHEIQGFPINNDPNNNSTHCNLTLGLKGTCPQTLGVEGNDHFNPLVKLSLNNCTSSGEKCVETELLGIRIGTTQWTLEKWKKCGNYHLIGENVLRETDGSLNEINCDKNIAKFVQIALKQTSGLECVLSVQQYRIEESSNNCTNETEVNSIEHEILEPPYCFSYDCTQQSNIIFEISLKKDFEKAKVNPDEDAELYLEERSPMELAVKDEKHEVHRIKNPLDLSWKDHVLEITIFSIIAAILILIGLKICFSEKFIEKYQHARIESAKKNSERMQKWFPHQRQNPLISNGGGKVHGDFDRSKPPSKPILKNKVDMDMEMLGNRKGSRDTSSTLTLTSRNGNNLLKKPANKNRATQPQEKREKCEGRQAAIMAASREMKSFESNGSIYYDTIEYPPHQNSSPFQPLISKSN